MYYTVHPSRSFVLTDEGNQNWFGIKPGKETKTSMRELSVVPKSSLEDYQ